MNGLLAALQRKKQTFDSEFASGGFGARIRLIGRSAMLFLCYVPLVLIATIIVPFVFLVLIVFDPIVRIRIGKLTGDRIGHLAYDTDLYLRRQQLRKKAWREFHIMVCDSVANRQLLAMIKRRVCVLEQAFFLKLYETAYVLFPAYRIWANPRCDYNAFVEYRRVPAQLNFTPQEMARGARYLQEMGIPPGSVFVCLHARDKSYLSRGHENKAKRNWRYHDYRDSDIARCLPAAEYLAQQGIYVLRMGHTVEQPLKTSNPRIIDYASHYRSDFMDVYLAGNCKFFIGDTAGLHCVALVLGVPVAATNWIPLMYAPPSQNAIFIPKKLWRIEQEKLLTFAEILSSGIDQWQRSEDYAMAGIEVIDNSPEEILALVKEMNARIDGSWNTTQEDEGLQARYRSLFPQRHYSYGFSCRIGAEFLRQNQNLLGEKTREIISVHS